MTFHPTHAAAEKDSPHSLPVHFECAEAEAVSVYIAGTFNNWQPDATPMLPVENHRWVNETILPPGTSKYCLVVNGEFRPDPGAPAVVRNSFGGWNSILKVMAPHEAARYATQEFLQKNWRNQ